MTERTLILIKPDGVKNGHVGEIIARIERKGLKLAELDPVSYTHLTLPTILLA